MKVFLSAVLALTALSSGSIVKPSGSDFELLILHNNDMHARFEQTSQYSGECTTADREANKCYGGFPRVAHVVKEARQKAQTGEGPPVLYLNAGDTYTGTAWFTIYKWKIAAEFINALQPDAVSLGNHDLDDSISGLTPFIKAVTCPVLAANLNLTRVPELQAEKNLLKSVVFQFNSTKIGIIGYLTPETSILGKKNNIEYIDEIVAIEKEAAKLKAKGVNILIALGHSGYIKDLEIAKKVNDIDLVIGGHSHTFLWNGTSPDAEKSQGPYPTMVVQDSGKTVPTVQAYAYTKYLGKILLTFDSNGDLGRVDGNPILLDNSIPQDPDVLEITAYYSKQIQKYTERIIGETLVNLDGLSCRLKECNMGNLVADAMIHKYASEYEIENLSEAPVAAINGGTIRVSLEYLTLPANVTEGALIQVLPIADDVVKMSINGSTIQKMFEHSVLDYNPINAGGRFLQVSGLKVVYNFKLPPGKMVENIYVRCSQSPETMFSVLNMTKVYDILVTNYMATGGDGFSFLTGLPFTTLDFDPLKATKEYFARYSPVSSSVEGRITIKHLENYNTYTSLRQDSE